MCRRVCTAMNCLLHPSSCSITLSVSLLAVLLLTLLALLRLLVWALALAIVLLPGLAVVAGNGF